MKPLNVIFIILVLFANAPFQGIGQQVDLDRMEKDLKVAETILESLAEEEYQKLTSVNRYQPNIKVYGSQKGNISVLSSTSWRTQPSSRSQYLEGFGVILRFNTNNGLWRTFSFADRPPNVLAFPGEEMSSNQRLDVSDIGESVSPDEQLSETEEKMETFKSIMVTYLLEYADLIGQLKPDDKIMVAENSGQSMRMLHQDIGMEGLEKLDKSWSALIKKEDLNAFKSGDISRAEAINRISFIENQIMEGLSKDAIMLANILERLYAPDISSTYYLQRKSTVERISNFGVVYKFDFYSSIKINEDNFDMPTLGLNGLTQIERDHKVKKLYLQFLTDIKQQVITYGKTVKSLQPGETLMLRINLTPCKDCGIPDKLEIIVKTEDLKAFDEGKLSEKQMLNLVTIIEKDGEA